MDNRILMNKKNVESVKLYYDNITGKHCMLVRFVSGESDKFGFNTEEEAIKGYELFYDEMPYVEIYGD